MKRIISILILLLLVLGLFAGCNSGEDPGLTGVTGSVGGNLSQESGGEEPAGDPSQDTQADQSGKKEENAAPDSITPGPESGNEENTAPRPSAPDPEVKEEEEKEKDYSDYITVVSYNVKHLNLGTRIDDVVALIRQMDGDIVGLQEVSEDYVTTGNQVEFLARKCGYDYYYFCPSTTAPGDSGRYGSGFLSRYPILTSENAKFSFTGGQDRRYSRAVLDVDGVEVAYYNTHLLTGEWQDTGKQFTELMRLAEGEKRPAIVTGDFNLSVGQQVELINLKKMTPLNGGPTGLFSLSDISYDNIIVSAGDFDYYEDERTVTNIKVIVSDASDHNPVYSYIKFK